MTADLQLMSWSFSSDVSARPFSSACKYWKFFFDLTIYVWIHWSFSSFHVSTKRCFSPITSGFPKLLSFLIASLVWPSRWGARKTMKIIWKKRKKNHRYEYYVQNILDWPRIIIKSDFSESIYLPHLDSRRNPPFALRKSKENYFTNTWCRAPINAQSAN